MKITITDFYAEWCQPCKSQDSIIEELKKKYKDNKNIEFKKVDVDKNEKIAHKYEVYAIPTITIEKDGKFIKKHIGLTSFKMLQLEIEGLKLEIDI